MGIGHRSSPRGFVLRRGHQPPAFATWLSHGSSSSGVPSSCPRQTPCRFPRSLTPPRLASGRPRLGLRRPLLDPIMREKIKEKCELVKLRLGYIFRLVCMGYLAYRHQVIPRAVLVGSGSAPRKMILYAICRNNGKY